MIELNGVDWPGYNPHELIASYPVPKVPIVDIA